MISVDLYDRSVYRMTVVHSHACMPSGVISMRRSTILPSMQHASIMRVPAN